MSNPIDEDFLTPHDYEGAIAAQSACNLSGIVHAFSAVLHKIWNESRRAKTGTLYVNEHPISVLYAAQIAWLATGSAVESFNVYRRAYEACERGAKLQVQ